MKPEIHPKYYEKSTVKCACGSTLTVGATKPDITVEICGKCHPFYTGKEKMIDTAGKVEKFKARREKAAANSSAVRRPKKEKRAQKTKAKKAKK